MPRDLELEKLYTCPIRLMIMKNPVSASDGYSYEEEALLEHLRIYSRSPMTQQELSIERLHPNRGLQDAIEKYLRDRSQDPGITSDELAELNDNTYKPRNGKGRIWSPSSTASASGHRGTSHPARAAASSTTFSTPTPSAPLLPPEAPTFRTHSETPLPRSSVLNQPLRGHQPTFFTQAESSRSYNRFRDEPPQTTASSCGISFPVCCTATSLETGSQVTCQAGLETSTAAALG